MVDLLHLSDLHFSTDSHIYRFHKVNPKELAQRFVEPLKEQRVAPNYVVLSGDFVQDGDTAEFQLARPFISALLTQLKLDRSRLVIVPGNHDIRWKRGSKLAEGEERVAPYREFFELVRGREPNPLLSDFIVDTEITLLALNSSVLESLKCPGFGLVGDDQLAQAWEEVQKQPNYSDSAPRVGVIHHHVVPVSWLEPLREDNVYSLTLDAERVQQWFLKNGFRVLLHGHQHQPFLRAVSDPGRDHGPNLLISGAGSACGALELLGDYRRNHYQVLRIAPGYTEIQWYQSHYQSSDAFEFDRSICHPPGADKRQSCVRLWVGISGATSKHRADITRQLARNLSAKLGDSISVKIQPSPARDIIKEGYTHDQQTTQQDYAVYSQAHLKNLNDAPTCGVVLFDRTFLDTLAFAELNGNLEAEWLLLFQQTAQFVSRRFDVYFYVQEPSIANFEQERTWAQRVDDAVWSVLQRYRSDAYNLSVDRMEQAVTLISDRLEALRRG